MPRPVLLIAVGSRGIGAPPSLPTPDEVAETILFLLSDAASYGTGALLNATRG
jgi:NAD(P)-dependent dehydrogenase (short-subunit alcohol dehydrogenase family)